MNGDQIRAEREARKWTQQQLAEKLGVGQRTVGNWERGETVPQNRMGALHQLFGIKGQDALPNPLQGVSDFALLSELMRRALDRQAET